jgi:flagellar FliJ protein
MKKFVFSLESVLKAKEVLDRQKVQELSQLEEKKRKVIAELTYLTQRRNNACIAFSNQMGDGTTVSKVKTYYQYLTGLKDMAEQKENVLTGYKKEEADLRLQLMEIRRDKKMLETLKDKKLQQYRKELQAEDERLIDELVSFRETASRLQEVQ